mgnify:CR=1 FL=1
MKSSNKHSGRIASLGRRARVGLAAGRQRGFTLIELAIVGVIITIVMVLAMPSVKAKIIESKTPTVAGELQQAVVRINGSRASMGTAPYGTIAIAELGQVLRNTSFTITGAPPTAVQHSLGTDAGVAAVTVAPATLNAANDSFTVTLAEVHRAACSGLAVTLSGYAEVISLTPNGGGATVLKAAGGVYDPALALSNCGERNTLAFTFT